MNKKIIFDKIAQKVLSPEQINCKPILEEFCNSHILVGGTAIALILGHRKSIDFDLFSFGPQGTGKQLFQRIQSTGLTLEEGSSFNYLSDEEESEVEILINGVRVQLIDFSRTPYNTQITIPPSQIVCESIRIPSILDLASMKLYAMMYRKKWKDAVDLYFLVNEKNLKFSEIVDNTNRIFQECYKIEGTLDTILAEEWDKTEAVEYLAKGLDDEIVENYLIELVHKYIENA